ncbi:MAG: bifunctional DNA-formamidopyrimidine glycosylase/DNA-(apurinic or apyrimidinic site) lyase [Pirellulales bacterium]
MPELPEVETMRRGIAAVVGCRIRDVRATECGLRPIGLRPALPGMRKRAVGATIVGLGRVGKRVIVELETHDRLIFEPRMTGLVLVADAPNREHLRLRIVLQGGGVRELLYWDRRGLGSVSLVSPDEFEQRYGLHRIGPDALSITSQELRDRLGGSRRAIKVALLDQSAVAGVGNLYASEILHRCGIHPARPANLLRAAQWPMLHAAMLDVLQTAILHEGSTLSDGTYRNALNQAGGYQNHHCVYDREDEPCPTCRRGKIVRIVQAQRSTFFCPRCQKAAKNAKLVRP